MQIFTSGLMICPLCQAPLRPAEGQLVCENRHAYDIARQGYVNLLRRGHQGLYEDAALFRARRAVYAAGFFAPLIEILERYVLPGPLLDAGCGEGSLLAGLCRPGGAPGMGIDIARDAVRMAAGAYKAAFFAVADLCHIPLAPGSVDTLLNVLTPANFDEFSRVLRSGGRLLKVAPGACHLREIRRLIGKAPYAPAPAETQPPLSRRFTVLRREPLRYAVPCDAALAKAVFAMTPLTAHDAAMEMGPGDITVDLVVIVAEKR